MKSLLINNLHNWDELVDGSAWSETSGEEIWIFWEGINFRICLQNKFRILSWLYFTLARRFLPFLYSRRIWAIVSKFIFSIFFFFLEVEKFWKKNFLGINSQDFPIFLQDFRHCWLPFVKNLTFPSKSPAYLFYGDGLFNPRIFLRATQ